MDPINTLLNVSGVLGQNGSGGGSATLIDNKDISVNGEYPASADNADGYKKVTVAVPNTYSASDEGKVVSNGALVSQTAHAEVTSNGTIDTTTNNSVTVNVANSYAAGDEGKVVSNGALVAQSSDTVTQNGTVDTTLINSLTVNVAGQTLPSTYKMVCGELNVASASEYLYIPLGDSGITSLVFVYVMCNNSPNWSANYGSYKRVALGTVDFKKAAGFINTGSDVSEVLEITDAGGLDYWNGTAGHTCSISSGNVVLKIAKSGLRWKPQVPYNYFVLGV